jgi:hypothetical protein
MDPGVKEKKVKRRVDVGADGFQQFRQGKERGLEAPDVGGADRPVDVEQCGGDNRRPDE